MTIELNGSISEVEIMCQEIRKGGGGCDSSKKVARDTTFYVLIHVVSKYGK